MEVARCQLVIPLTQRADEGSWTTMVRVVQELKVGSEKSWEVLDTKRTHYLAILSATMNKPPFNRWLVCHQNTPTVPDTPTSGCSTLFQQVYGWSTLVKELINFSETQDMMETQDSEGAKHLAVNIHFLLDHLPWKLDEYVVVDVLLLVLDNSWPSLSVQGALMRLKEWLGAQFHMIIPSSNSCSLEWGEHLMASVSSLASDLEFSWDVLWRGSLLLHEHKPPGKAQANVLSFDGFSLRFNHDCLHFSDRETLDATGLTVDSTHHPSHLELVQVVDAATFPLMWLSPLCLSLSLDESHRSSPSSVVFRKLLHPVTSRSAILLQLCLTRPECECPSNHRTTEDWMREIVDREISSFASSSSYYHNSQSSCDGVFLYVHPCTSRQNHENQWTCDSWLLWKPQALLGPATVVSQLRDHQCREISTEDQTSLMATFDGLPVYGWKEKQWRCVEYNRKDFLSKCCYDQEDPSQWKEMRALSNHEWIQSHIIKRRTTPDLMFGTVVAPPPSNKGTPTVNDILNSFTGSGTPVDSDLSPVAMCGGDESSRPVHMITPGKSPVSYWKVLGSTPTSARKYHGVRYCLSDSDVSHDARLTKIQQRYLSRERSSYCLESDSTKREVSRHKRKQSESKEKSKDTSSIIEQKLSPQQDTSRSLKAPSTAGMDKRSRLASCGASRGRKRRRLRLAPIMKETASSKTVDTMEASTDEAGDGEIPTGTTGLALSNRKDPVGTEKDRNGELPMPDGKVIGTSTNQTTGKAIEASTMQTNSLAQSKTSLCHSKGDKDTIVTTAACKNTEISSAGLKMNSTTVERTKGTNKKKDPTSKKKLLEGAVVASLKANGMPRTHSCFKKAYVKLFDLSKLFLKDFNFKDSTVMAEEIQKVVTDNAPQVIMFVLKQAGRM